VAKTIRRIEIEPAENGGHTVRHYYREEMKKDRHSHSGMAPQYHEPEHHVFGEHEGHEMLAHVANHLAIPVEEKGETDTETDNGKD
jgi:hypothetical protein